MSAVLARLLLLTFLVSNLESFASLETSETSHDDIRAMHIHDDAAAPVEPTDSDGDAHCSHCFHHHATGLLTQVDNLLGQEPALYNAEIKIRFDSNPIIPPTPPPNFQI
jgi:hypothetical protein